MRYYTALAFVLALFAVGAADADEFAAILVKVVDGKVTYSRGTGKKKVETTLSADDGCQVVVGKYDAKTKKIEAGDVIGDGLKNAIFTQLDKEEIGAWVRTNADNSKILELRVYKTAAKKKKTP
jgi:hypothetical protein